MTDRERPAVAKVIVRVPGGDYIMSRKRSRHSVKDDRLEFLGGRLETSDADAWAAVLRESLEEEESGSVAAALRAQRPAPRAVRVGGAQGELHYCYEIEVAAGFETQLRPGDESRGFEVVHASLVHDAAERVRTDRFTPKTLSILEALLR